MVALVATLGSWSASAGAQSAEFGRRRLASEAEHGAPSGQSERPGVINLNTASIDQLTRLPGIGPARAAAVLELRAKLTQFRRLEDLMRVKGIGRKTFRKLQPMLRLSGETTLVERARSPCDDRRPR
jgi:competence protein ComEA